MADSHIHTPDDGRQLRIVYVDGKRVDEVFYADTKRGVVDAYRRPHKIHKYGKRLLTKRHRGKVEVVEVCSND